MVFRNTLPILFFIFFGLIKFAFAQIVDDSTKVIYGTNTTKVFTQDVVYKNQIYFYNRDSMFARPFKSRPINFDLNYNATKTDKKIVSTIVGIYSNDSVTYSKSSNKKIPKKKKISFEDSSRLAFNNRYYKNFYKFFRVDTGVSTLHNFNYIYVDDNIYQNQAVIGTPSKPVFHVPKTELGFQSGFDTYNQYFLDPRNVKYYNTRSPYALVDYLANTGDENKIKIEFSRNIMRNWNVGFSYTRLNSNRQMSLTARDKMFLASNQDFILFTSFKSKNERYHFMGNFKYFVSKTNEQGGLRDSNLLKRDPDNVSLHNMQAPPANIDSWPVYLNAQDSKLEPYRNKGAIYSRDRRVAYHFYQQYDLLPKGKLSIFHEFDRRNQRFTFEDPLARLNISSIAGNSFYPKGKQKNDTTFTPFLNDSIGKLTNNIGQDSVKLVRRYSDTINYNNDYAFTTNKIGVKSTFGRHTWIGYAKHRNIFSGNNSRLSVIQADKIFTDPVNSFGTWLVDDPKSNFTLNEYYAGGEYIYNTGDSLVISVKGEFIFANSNKDKYNAAMKDAFYNVGNHLLGINLHYKNIDAGINRTTSSPTMLNLNLNNNFYIWQQKFNAIQTNTLFVSYKNQLTKTTFVEIKPSIINLYNYIYYDKNTTPTQADRNIFIGTMDLKLNQNFGPFYIELFAKYTYNSETEKGSDGVIRMPTFYANPKIYFKIQPKKKVWRQQFLLGMDFHYRSQFYGDAYMPMISQFHLQNDFILNDYLLVDAFVNVKIRNARLFVKYNQLNQIFGNGAPAWLSGNGYYVSPGYVSVRSFVTFGLQWMLFD